MAALQNLDPGIQDPKPVLPSKSDLSDLGLILDLVEKILLNWSSFCLKICFFAQKVQRV